MFTEKIASLWDQLKVVFSDFAFTDFLDICLVAFILYSVIKLIRETKAIQLARVFCFSVWLILPFTCSICRRVSSYSKKSSAR